MLNEQRIRGFLFYFSVCVFFSGLPFILSFALGYKFDRRLLKFTKTGLIFLKTQPQGASIYLDEKILDEKTPATLRELLPGKYKIKVELEKHYPWAAEVTVEPRKVSMLDKIILFPLRPNIKQINKGNLDFFWIDEEKGLLYFVNYNENIVYSSDMEGNRYEKAAGFAAMRPLPMGWKLSLDREKLLYFNKHQIGVTYLEQNRNKELTKEPFILNYTGGAILEAFWHSDNYHVIVVTNRKVEALEAKAQSVPVELAILNNKDASVSYNIHEDALYFTDYQRSEDGIMYKNLYKLELRSRFFPFLGFDVKIKTNE